jgi:hypothetical protein
MGKRKMGDKNRHTHRSCDTVLNSPTFSGLLCMRSDAVSTNWPTVAPKPERNALNGYRTQSQISLSINAPARRPAEESTTALAE